MEKQDTELNMEPNTTAATDGVRIRYIPYLLLIPSHLKKTSRRASAWVEFVAAAFWPRLRFIVLGLLGLLFLTDRFLADCR